MSLTLDEQYDLLAKRNFLQGERKAVVEQLATWERCVMNGKEQVARYDDAIAELETRLLRASK